MANTKWKTSEIKTLRDIMKNGTGLFKDRIEQAAKTLGKSAYSCHYVYYRKNKSRKVNTKRSRKSAKVTVPTLPHTPKTTTLEFNLVSVRIEGTKLFIEIKA